MRGACITMGRDAYVKEGQDEVLVLLLASLDTLMLALDVASEKRNKREWEHVKGLISHTAAVIDALTMRRKSIAH